MGSDDLIASIGRLLERIDFSENGDEFACNIPLDDGVFEGEDIDQRAFIEELVDTMSQLGVTVKEASLVDGEGHEYPLPLPRRTWHMHYILDEQGQPVPTYDHYAIDRLLSNRKKRMVAKTYFVYRGARVEVSTVFLVLNHAYLPGAKPVLWESMIFTEYQCLNGTQARYTSREKAVEGHQLLVEYAREFVHRHYALRRPRKPTIHQAFAALRRQRRGAAAQRKQGGVR